MVNGLLGDDAFTDIRSLDPLTRAHALVGAFLQTWSFMEHKLRRAIGKALGLDAVQEAVVAANIQLRDKINILKTVVHLQFPTSSTECTAYVALLNKVANEAPIRNMMAHDMFGASDDGLGVRFFVTKAKGKPDFPETIWSVEDFDAAGKRIDEYGDQLNELISRIVSSQLARALAMPPLPKASLPMGGLFGLGLPLPPIPQPQVGPSSDTSPATPETGDGNPPKPEK